MIMSFFKKSKSKKKSNPMSGFMLANFKVLSGALQGSPIVSADPEKIEENPEAIGPADL